jgi:hypothetical protein
MTVLKRVEKKHPDIWDDMKEVMDVDKTSKS